MEEQGRLNPKAKKTEKSVGFSPSIEELPNAILTDILSRLPFKSLIYCRCVCKSFLYLISLDPEFPPLHLSRSLHELILCPPHSDKIILVDSDADQYHQLNLPSDADLYPDLNPRSNELPSMWVVNSSRGLLCLRFPYLGPVCVLNPATMEFTLIPEPVKDRKNHLLLVGFGYSPMADKYKVLRIVMQRSGEEFCCLTEIYTLGAPSWRRIEDDAPTDVMFRDFFPTFLNGSLHWLINEDWTYSLYSDYMVSFDFDNEKFGEIALPPPFDLWPDRDSVPVISLGIFEDCLSVCMWSIGDRVDVWVMKEYGVRESWSREIVVDTPHLYWPEGSFPLKYMNNDKVEVLFFNANYALVTYNLLEKKVVKYIKVNGLPPKENFEAKALAHLPTLLSLKELAGGAEVHLMAERNSWKRWTDLLVYDLDLDLDST